MLEKMEEAIKKKRKDYPEKLVTLGTGYRTMTKQQKNTKKTMKMSNTEPTNKME
jgi:hypothetical protein